MAKAKGKKITIEDALLPADEQPYEVPQNWCWIYWGNAGEFIAGSGFKNSYQGFAGYDIPFYKVGSLKYSDNKGYLFDDSNSISEKMRLELKATLIPINSVLFAKIGEAIRLNRRSMNSIPCCIDNNMMAFVPKACDYKYAYYWSKGLELYEYTNATTVPAIRKSDLEKIPFPLPPLAEQQRIVEQIESLFSKLDEAMEKLQIVIDSYDDRRASILHKAFEGRITKQWRKRNNIGIESWNNTTIGEIAELVTKGASPRWQGVEYLDDSTQTLFVTSENVREGYLDLTKKKYLDNRINEIQKRSVLKKGDVLVNIVGASIGRSAIYNMDKKANTNQAVCLIRLLDIELNQYVCFYLNSPVALRYYSDNKSETARANLSLADINSLPISIPSKAEAEEIMRVVKMLMDNEDKVMENAEITVENIDLIKKSILAKAFRGELGTTDASEESSIKLLKQILEKG